MAWNNFCFHVYLLFCWRTILSANFGDAAISKTNSRHGDVIDSKDESQKETKEQSKGIRKILKRDGKVELVHEFNICEYNPR